MTIESESPRRSFSMGPCLGQGGFGEVYLATMASVSGLQTSVAVKVLRADLAPQGQALERLRDEAKLLAQLNHPTILRVYDLVLLDGRVSLVAEYIEGQDLGECFHGEAPITTRATLECLGAVADALHSAWAAPLPDGGRTLQLVHRDIKPSNIRVSRHGQVKLLDFGIARTDQVSREAKTQTNLMVGSPAYMAPERFLSDDAHPGSDVFALGATLYESLVGERLFRGVPIIRMSALALDETRYRTFVDGRLDGLPECPVTVLGLLRSCLAYDPNARPTARHMAKRCEELADEVGGASLARWCRARSWPGIPAFEGPLEGLIISEGTLSRSDIRPVSAPVLRQAPETEEVPLLDEPTRFERTVPAPPSSDTVERMHSAARVDDEELESGGRWGMALGVFAAMAVVAMGLGVLVLVGAGGAWMAGLGGEPSVEAQTIQVDATPPQEVDATPQLSPAMEVRPVVKPAPIEVEAPVSEAPVPTPVKQHKTAKPRHPAPVAAPLVFVSLHQSDVPVSLVGSEGTYSLPGDVPPGSYTVVATLNGNERATEQLVVVEGGAPVVKCTQFYRGCKIISGTPKAP